MRPLVSLLQTYWRALPLRAKAVLLSALACIAITVLTVLGDLVLCHVETIG